MFIAALLIRAKTQKQPKCPSAEGWIKKMRCVYTMEYYSAIKRNKIMPFAAMWMDLEIIMWNLKKIIQVSLFTKEKIDSQTEKINMVTNGEWEVNKLGVWD